MSDDDWDGTATHDLLGDQAGTVAATSTDRFGVPLDGYATDDDTLTAVDDEQELSLSTSLFDGDRGSLDLMQRRALVYVLKQRFLSRRTHPREWAALEQNPEPLRARLNDLFLILEIDHERKVAYKRPAIPEGGGSKFATLLYNSAWGREDTIALICLRVRHRSEVKAGNAPYIDRDDIADFVAAFRPSGGTDLVTETKRNYKPVETLFQSDLLIGSSTGTRFEISNAIEVVLPLSKLHTLLSWLRETNESAAKVLLGAPADPTADDLDISGTAPDTAPDDDPEPAESEPHTGHQPTHRADTPAITDED